MVIPIYFTKIKQFFFLNKYLIYLHSTLFGFLQQIIPGTAKTQAAGSVGNYQPLIISGMSPGIQQSTNQVLSLLTPIVTQGKILTNIFFPMH
jgi:hypothetical protein